MAASWHDSESRCSKDDKSSTGNVPIRSSTAASSFQYSERAPSRDDSESRPSLLKKRFTSGWARRRHGEREEQQESIKGPLGLRLLHPSPEPLVDLIFVHGLKGDSIKTWRKGGDLRRFWPQFWLPMEEGMQNVNIHTFGYDANWSSSSPDILNVHTFGRSLLEDMRNAPSLWDSDDRPIILLGHSMGGLVIKKAFILSKDVPSLSTRIRCIFFLSTPHRGSNYASILNNIISAVGLHSRQYLSDIATGSLSIQLLNDDFGKLAHELPIFSFWEREKMSVGPSSILVVEMDSAILGHGYVNERTNMLHANHRDMCKFESTEDDNYLRVKNALVSAVRDLQEAGYTRRKEKAAEQMTLLGTYLGVSGPPVEHHTRVEGSCEWIDARDDFQDWRDCIGNFSDEGVSQSQSRNLSIFWVHANPGSGKTILASHIVSQLQGFNLECAYYYFHAGDKSSRSVGALLRSLAYQMATSNNAIRDRLTKLREEGSTFDMDDTQTIWLKLFKKGILQAPTYTPQYWVIDALDECQKYQELFTMLKNERPAFPLRIFITSRLMSDIYRIQKPLESSAILVSIGIPTQDSASDIERYIASRTDILPIDSERERTELAATIFRKSAGSFLWVRLVLDELEKVYASESIKKIIDSIPEGMVPYYQRIVQSMAANTLEKHISKAVLMWTVSCTRKMRIEELTHALKLDINTVLPSAKSAVEGLCGQLVTIDSTSGIVSLIHLTAREFLLADAGDFTIPKAASHERAAKACLALLSSAELKPPRTARQLSQAKPAASPFLDYAMTQFSEHIFFASAESEDLLGKIDAFLKTNALSWIERMARAGTLHILTRTSKNLKSYVDRREKYKSPLDRQIRNVDSWTIDLSRLVTQFGEALLHDPASIYFLIPPLCPTGSAIYQSFGKRSDGLVLVGHKDSAWDDCIAYVNFRDDMSSAVSCGESLIAVGMESGKVNLYNPRSCHKEAEIPHKHPIDLVHLSNGLLISCTTRFLVVHDINGTFLWQQRLKYRLLLLTSSEDNIVGVSQRGRYLRWNKKTGELVGDQDFPYRCDNDEEEGDNSLARRAPHVTSISPDFETLALGYRGGVVSLWDVEGVEHIGWAKDDQGRNPAKLLFNPNPNINLLLVIYNVNGLALFDTWSGSLQQEFTFSEDIGLLTASCSPDGRTLVTTDAQGNLHIWDFESLSILYHIHAPFPSFRILSFTSDGSYIVDVMDSSMRIWSPSVLVRKSIDEDASISDDASQLTIAEGISDAERTGKTTAIFPHPNLPVVLAGKYNGDVVAFSSKENKPAVHLYSHSESSFVVRVTAHKSNKVASSDVSGLVKIYSLSPTCLKLDSSPLELRINGAVRQLCFDESGDYLLISTALSDQVYSLRKGHCVGSLNFSPGDRKCWRWFSIPQRTSNGACLANVCDGVLRQYSIDSFPSLIDEDAELYLQYSPSDGSESKKEVEIEIATLSHSMKVLAMQIRYDTGFSFSSSTFLFDLSSTLLFTESSAKKIALSPVNQPITSTCKYFLGFSETAKSIIFLHHNSWVSSFDPTGKAPSQWVQHFFIPNDYLHSAAEALPVRTADGDIVLSHHGELVAIRNGMKFRSVRDLK